MKKRSKFLLILTFIASAVGLMGCEKLPTEPEWVIQSEQKPTCTEEGKIVFVNSITGETKTEKIPALGHKITSNVLIDEYYADAIHYDCSACDFEEYIVKFVDESEGTITFDNESNISSFNYEVGNKKISLNEGVWTLTIDEVVTPITFDVDIRSISLAYQIVKYIPDLESYSGLDVSVSSVNIGNNRMGINFPGYNVSYKVDGFSYRPHFLSETLECVFVQTDKDGKSYYSLADGTVVYYTENIKDPFKTIYNHCAPDGTLLDVRVRENGFTYLYEADGITLIKASTSDNSIYYDKNMNQITETEWNAIPLNYSYLWNEAWASYGMAVTRYNDGDVVYTLNPDTTVKTFEYVKDNVKVTCAEGVWTLSIGDVVSTITFEENINALRMIYEVIDNLPELGRNTSLEITVENNVLDGSRMGNVTDIYRIIYNFSNESYKYSLLKDSLEPVMLQYTAEDKVNKFYKMDGTHICSLLTVSTPAENNGVKIVNHYDNEGNIVNVRKESDSITYYYASDSTTLIKAQQTKSNIYYDNNMNEITEAEWYAIPLEYSHLWNRAWATYGKVETTHNGGTVKYTLNPDTTISDFEYSKDDVKLTYSNEVWTLKVGEITAPIIFEEDSFSLRMIYKIIDNLPDLEDNTSLTINVAPTNVGLNRMGNETPGYRIIYDAKGGHSFGYKPNFLKDTLECILIHLDKDGKSYYMNSEGEVIYYTKNSLGTYYHCAPDGTVLDVRVNDYSMSYIYTPDGKTLVKASSSSGKYYDGNMNTITEAEWNAIPLNYSYLWNEEWFEFSDVKVEFLDGTIEYSLNSDTTVNSYKYVRGEDSLVKEGTVIYIYKAGSELVIDVADEVVTPKFMLDLVIEHFNNTI